MKRSAVWAYSVATFLAVMTFDAGHHAAANEFKRIRDVNVSCSNTLRCDLYISNPRVTLYEFGFRRSSARQAPISLVISSRQALRTSSDVIIFIDGREVFNKPVAAFSYRAATDEYIYDVQEDVLALLGESQRGTDAQIRYATSNARSTAPFSLSGMVAGSLFMDDVQGRVGEEFSMMALGRQSNDNAAQAEAQIAGRAIESWDELPVEIGAYYGAENRLCENAIDGSSRAPDGGFAISGNGEKELLVLPCGLAAAYNVTYAIFETDGDVVLPVSLPTMSTQGPIVARYLSNVSWDDATKTLTSFHKGRGLGDCGNYAKWRLGDVAGEASITLLEAKEKQDCDGQYKDDFSDYNTLWLIED